MQRKHLRNFTEHLKKYQENNICGKKGKKKTFNKFVENLDYILHLAGIVIKGPLAITRCITIN